MEGNKTRAGIAGVVAASIALGVGELLAGLFDAVPSPLASVGGFVVDSTPSFVEDFAIAVFGTADKAALAIGTSVVALLVGWQTGIQAARRFWVGPMVFGLFGGLRRTAATWRRRPRGITAGWELTWTCSRPWGTTVPG